MPEQSKLYFDVAKTLRQARSIALCGHVMPDGDCLGSMLALGRALKIMGKDVLMLSPDPVPEVYSFLPGAGEISVTGNDRRIVDVFVSVDCSVPDRLGRHLNYLERAGRVIVLDHHAGAAVFGHIYLNEPDYAATGEMVYELLRLLPVSLDKEMAACLYVAITTDTGSFRYDNTRPQTHIRVAELFKSGIDAARINKLLYEEKPLVTMKVLGRVLQSLCISDCGRVAWMSVSQETLRELNASNEHVDGVINYPRAIKGVELALFYREMEANKYKVSLRSKYYLDVNKLAAQFGGGGHRRAAGCIIEGCLEEIQRRMLKAALIALKDEGN